MINKTAKRFFVFLLTVFFCFTLFSFFSGAEHFETKGSITLTVVDKETKVPISGAVFRIYNFASAYISEGSYYCLYTEEFKNNGMEPGDFSDEYLPVHLAAFAQSESIAYTEKSTDSSGKVVFDNLPLGAYLVVPVGIDEAYLSPNPFIVAVPLRDEVTGEWVYDIDATPKIAGDDDADGEITYISVKKIWEGSGEIPESITVSLIKDGISVDSVVLSSENNWYYKWEGLNKNHSWKVVENKVPVGYSVSYVSSQMTVTIINTADGYEQEPTTEPEELIDTGQLNWPVPVFSIAGLLLFSAGWMLLNFGKKDEEAA